MQVLFCLCCREREQLGDFNRKSLGAWRVGSKNLSQQQQLLTIALLPSRKEAAIG